MRFIVALLVLGLLAPVFALTNINSCTNISYSDEFVLTSDLVGNNTYPPWGITSCIYVYNSNVVIDCAGHNITGNESGSSYGIWINPYLKNITIKNCNGISNYSTGIHFYTDINDSLITNNTFFNLGMGIFLNPGCHNNVIANNYFHNNGAGIQIAYPTVMDNLIANNTAFDNTNHGFSFSGSNNTYINNSAIQNGYSGFFLTSANSTYINNTANNNTFAGIYLIGSGCVNNTLSGSIASFNGVGVYFSDGAANNTFSNSTLSNNSQGIEIVSGSNGNRFIDTRIYGSTSYGVSFNHTTFNNNLTNTFIYGQADYINQQATAPGPNNFFNLTLGYNSTIGLVNYPFLNVTDAVLDTNFFLLQPDWVSLDDANVPQANVSATVTLNTSDCSYVVFKKSGFPSSFGDIVANGNVCPTTLSCAGGVATFSVASFSGYAMGPSPTGCVNLSDPSTWAGRVANDTATGTLMVNANITLCRGNYYLDSVSNPALEMNASGIYLDCNGSTLDAASPGFGMAIFSTGKENLTIENCTILYYQNGIHLDQTNSSRIAFNTIIGTGRGIGLFYDSNRNQALNNTILNSTSYGIEVSASGQNLLHNNTVDTAFAQAVIITYSNGTRFLDNNVSNSSWECLWLADLSYAEVSGNNILDCGRWGNLLVARVNGSNFTGNVMRNNTGVGWIVYVGQSAGNLFEGNGLSAGYDGFNSDSSEGNTFRSNLVHGMGHAAFYLSNSNLSFLDSNTAYGNDWGFFFYYSNNNVLSNNTAHSNTNSGFELHDSSGNNFTDTIAYNNSPYAIFLYANAAPTINRLTNTLIYNQTYYLYAGPYWGPVSDTNFTNLTLGYNRTVGLINYPSMNITALTYLDDGWGLYLRPDWVSLDSSAPEASQANVSAYITINHSSCGLMGVLQQTGFPTNRPDMLLYGTHYPATVTCNGDLATFYVGGFSGYTLGQEQTHLTFSINDTSPVSYGTPINISCGASNSEVLLTIYANTTILAQSTSYAEFTGLLAAGLYNLSCNATGTENYSSAQDSAPFQIEKLDPSPSILFTADPGWSIAPGQTVNVSCFTANPEITLELWRDGGLVGTGSHIGEVWAPAAGTYSYVCNSTETENYTAYIQTSTLNVRTPSSGGGRETVEPQLSISAPDEAPQGSIMSITVEKEGGVTVPLVRVVVGQGSSVLLDEYTDAWGRVFFTPLSTGTYAITASRTGFLTATDSFSVFPAMGCGVDGDCAYNEACIAGNCTLIPPGECGTYAGHRWVDYTCCSDSDCQAGFRCGNHKCARMEEEHCASNDDCGPGYECSIGACVSIQRPECTNSMDCLPGFECRSGSCIMKERAPDMPVETITPVVVADNGRPGPFENEVRAASTFALPAIIAIILILAWLLWRRRKKGPQPDEFAP